MIVNLDSFLLKFASYPVQGVPRNMQVTVDIVDDWAQVVVKSNPWPTVRSTALCTLHMLG